MQRIVLISCVSKKKDIPALAKEMYISALFRYNLKYAMSLKPDKIYILSAKYGLLHMTDKIEPYNITLNSMNIQERKKWAAEVLKSLCNETNINNDEFIFLAGEKYRKFLVPRISNCRVPLQGKGIGKQLKFLKEKCNEQRM